MKWKSKKFGDIRIIKRFALFPVCINNEWRWFETVRIKQEVLRFVSVGIVGDIITKEKWENIEFIERVI